MPEVMPQPGHLLTTSELKALSWAVRRASNNGGGFARQIAAAQRVLDKLGAPSKQGGQSSSAASP